MHLRRVLASCVLAVVPASLPGQTLVVALPDESRVLLIDVRTFDTAASVPVGPTPHEIAVAPDGRHVYVGDAGGHTVTEIDLAGAGRTRTIDLGECSQPHDLRVSRSGALLWVACAPLRAIAEVDLASGKVARTWRTGIDGGWMLAASPDDRKLFVAHLEGRAVSAVDRTRRTTSAVRRPGEQIGIEVSPSGRELWVTGSDSGEVTVLDTGADTVLAAFRTGERGPVRVRFTLDGRLAVIPHDESSTLTLVDVASRRPVRSIPLAATPKVLALSRDGRIAVVSHPEAKLLSVVDLERQAVIRTISLPAAPDGVAYAEGLDVSP